jgi:hypothetical protein
MKVEHRSTEDLPDCRRLIDACGLDAQRLVLVHAGAQLPSRRRPIERFAQVARVLGATAGKSPSPAAAAKRSWQQRSLRRFARPHARRPPIACQRRADVTSSH